MSVLSGTLRITATNTPLTEWVATAHAVSDGHLVGRCQIVSEGDTPVQFEIDCGEYLQACLITVAPAMGDGWQPHAAMVEGSLRVPTDNALPIVLLVEHAPAGPDPYADQVVLFLPLDSDFLDTQGHEVVVRTRYPAGARQAAADPGWPSVGPVLCRYLGLDHRHHGHPC